MKYQDFEKMVPVNLLRTGGLEVFMSPDEKAHLFKHWLQAAYHHGHLAGQQVAAEQLQELNALVKAQEKVIKAQNTITIVHEGWFSQLLKRFSKRKNENHNS